MAIYYHVSKALMHNGYFYPRIPEHRHKESENETTPRVCVAPTIEDCLTAIPDGGSMLEELCIDLGYRFLVFRIDTEKLGINERDIVSSQELYEKDFVRDAEMTNEHWITVPFAVPEEDIFVIQISDWDEASYGILPFSIYKIAYEKFEGDFLRAYEKIYNSFIPCSIKIKNLQYTSEGREFVGLFHGVGA